MSEEQHGEPDGIELRLLDLEETLVMTIHEQALEEMPEFVLAGQRVFSKTELGGTSPIYKEQADIYVL